MDDKIYINILKNQKKISLIEYKLLKDFQILQKHYPDLNIQVDVKNKELIHINIKKKKFYYFINYI